MIYDPLFIFIKKTGVGYISLAVGYGVFFILAMTAMLYVSGKQKSVKEYFKDSFGVFIWPFFVLGPIVVSYLLISDLSTNIDSHLKSIGLSYASFSLKLDRLRFLFWLIIIPACAEGIENVVRYHKERPKLWLSKPRFLQPISTVLFNIPLGTMVLVLIVRLIDQWITFHRFMTSSWLPDYAYNVDEMYGLRWLYTILLTHITIAIIASFSSLLVLIREGGQKYSWIYKTVFLLSITCAGIALFTLFLDMNSLLRNINLHFLNLSISKINQFPQTGSNASLDFLIQKLLLIQEMTNITELPKSMPIPAWLSGIIGIRLIIFIPEIYAMLAKPLGWKKLPINIKRIIEFIK